MSFDLKSKIARFRWSNMGWAEVLSLAERYGWVPSGTACPTGMKTKEWEGGYATNDGQRVTSADAKALADALEQGFSDNFQQAIAAKPETKPVTEEERQQAIEKFAAIASSMSFEVVEQPTKRGAKPKRSKLPKNAEANTLEDALARQGVRPDELAALLTALHGGPPSGDDQAPWFTEEDGQRRIREFVAFCRKGAFRID